MKYASHAVARAHRSGGPLGAASFRLGWRRFALALVLLLGCAAGPALHAAEAPEVGDNPAAERRMMALAAELRCLQCQNQTLADSEAPLAVDLRQEIRELIAKNQSDEQIKAYLVARYGDFVLYRPPVKSKTLVLWFGPAVVLLGGLLALYLALKRRNARLAAQGQLPGNDADLSAADARRAQALLADDTAQGGSS
jgi:cytochrome c-type biogenesis protein CcmH